MALPVRSHNLSLRDRSGTLIPMRATTFRSPSAKPILPYGLVQYIDVDVDIDVYVTLRQSLCDKGFLGSPPTAADTQRLSVLDVRQDSSRHDLGPRYRQTGCQGYGFGQDDQTAHICGSCLFRLVGSLKMTDRTGGRLSAHSSPPACAPSASPLFGIVYDANLCLLLWFLTGMAVRLALGRIQVTMSNQ